MIQQIRLKPVNHINALPRWNALTSDAAAGMRSQTQQQLPGQAAKALPSLATAAADGHANMVDSATAGPCACALHTCCAS